MSISKCGKGKYIVVFVLVLGLFLVYQTRLLQSSMPGETKNHENISVLSAEDDILVSSAISKPRQSGNQPDVNIVLILAYHHTGSTFTGSILQQYPGTFYEYETLRALKQETKAGNKIRFLDGTERYLNGTDIDATLATDAVSNMITCNHGNLDTSTLSYLYFNIQSAVNMDQREYYACQGQSRRQLRTLIREDLIKRCLPRLTKRCKQSSIRVIKFIRLNMDVADRILTIYPNVKLIHLLRDPRAMMDSKVRKNDMNTRIEYFFIRNVKETCSKIRRHLDMLPELDNKFPGRIFQFRYEDLADNPIPVTRSIFDFVNLPFTRPLQTYVDAKAIRASPNSSDIARVWRNHLSPRNLELVNHYCEPLYTMLGYVRYDNIVDIRNWDKATYRHKFYYI